LWNYVIPHFTRFLKELELTSEERADADSKADRIARYLWSYYYFDYGEFKPYCYVKVGSYGKSTAIRPPTDLDMLFLLPVREFTRIGQLAGNKQSQLLQEVKDTLEVTFPRTDLRADGQVVIAPFQTYNVEIIPAFLMKDGTYITAHTANNGSWRASNPVVEYHRRRRFCERGQGNTPDKNAQGMEAGMLG
jgi:tRNA nucleotidyltransferase (CCA-adding enzyme)